jgi:putative restriction endonuclease
LFASRRDLAEAGVHPPHPHGISGSGADGADSIVVSGGYEDDEDYGDLIVYTGAGRQTLRPASR